MGWEMENDWGGNKEGETVIRKYCMDKNSMITIVRGFILQVSIQLLGDP